jgi:hypothetical protein
VYVERAKLCSRSAVLDTHAMATLSFDDSWMDEVSGQECAQMGEFKDDQVWAYSVSCG